MRWVNETPASSDLEHKQPNHTPSKDTQQDYRDHPRLSTGLMSLPWAMKWLERSFDSRPFPAALPRYSSLNSAYFPPALQLPMWTFLPRRKMSATCHNLLAQGAESFVYFFMGVLLSAEVPRTSILTILNTQFMTIFLSPGHWVVHTWL